MPPEALERTRPLVQRPDRLGVGSIEHPATVATYVDKADITQDAEVLRDGGLPQAQGRHNFSDRTLLQGQIVQYFSATGLGDGVEGVRCCGCAWHEKNNTCLYRNMSSLFVGWDDDWLSETGIGLVW